MCSAVDGGGELVRLQKRHISPTALERSRGGSPTALSRKESLTRNDRAISPTVPARPRNGSPTARSHKELPTRNDSSKARTSCNNKVLAYELALWTKNSTIMQRRASLLRARMEAGPRSLPAATTSSSSLDPSPGRTLVRTSSINLEGIDRFVYANDDWGKEHATIIYFNLGIGVILLMVPAEILSILLLTFLQIFAFIITEKARPRERVRRCHEGQKSKA